MIFKYNYHFNISKIQRLVNSKKLKILDFGCGLGNWNKKIIYSKLINKIILYDKNKNLINILKKKYPSQKIEINFNLKKIIKIKDYNTIIFSSVIQYISQDKLKKIIKKLTKGKKNITIIFIDVPYLPRIIEFFLLPFFSFKRFLFTLKLLSSNNYNKINYFLYNKEKFKPFNKKFDLKFLCNLHDLKFLRYTLVMKLK
jgi:hypothetical protein